LGLNPEYLGRLSEPPLDCEHLYRRRVTELCHQGPADIAGHYQLIDNKIMDLKNKYEVTMKVSGLAGCDSCRRARRWLDAHGARYRFRDLRDAPPDPPELRRWADAVGWETLLNRRSTTWRGLPPDEREGLDAGRAVALMAGHPTLVKRPVVEAGADVVVGVDEAAWARMVSP
jgi:Spx/MgsR family transcriptional regulator